MMQTTIRVSGREHERRRRQVAREPYHDAINRPLTLDLDPVAATPHHIRAIGALSNHAFDVIGLIDGLQTRIALVEQASKLAANENERRAHPRDTCKPQQVKDPAQCLGGHSHPGCAKLRLQRPEVDPARVVEITISPSMRVSDGSVRAARMSSGNHWPRSRPLRLSNCA